MDTDNMTLEELRAMSKEAVRNNDFETAVKLWEASADRMLEREEMFNNPL